MRDFLKWQTTKDGICHTCRGAVIDHQHERKATFGQRIAWGLLCFTLGAGIGIGLPYFSAICFGPLFDSFAYAQDGWAGVAALSMFLSIWAASGIVGGAAGAIAGSAYPRNKSISITLSTLIATHVILLACCWAFSVVRVGLPFGFSAAIECPVILCWSCAVQLRKPRLAKPNPPEISN